jgi:protein-S-isoprenylcysteine O-methyltransferase Ste14
MRCRNCGTEIADKALICYRCGTATTEAKFKAPAPNSRRSAPNLVATVLALALLVLFAIYMGRAATGAMPRALGWTAAAVAAAVVILRAIARRRE